MHRKFHTCVLGSATYTRFSLLMFTIIITTGLYMEKSKYINKM